VLGVARRRLLRRGAGTRRDQETRTQGEAAAGSQEIEAHGHGQRNQIVDRR
jgi:hypothetical protein